MKYFGYFLYLFFLPFHFFTISGLDIKQEPPFINTLLPHFNIENYPYKLLQEFVYDLGYAPLDRKLLQEDALLLKYNTIIEEIINAASMTLGEKRDESFFIALLLLYALYSLEFSSHYLISHIIVTNTLYESLYTKIRNAYIAPFAQAYYMSPEDLQRLFENNIIQPIERFISSNEKALENHETTLYLIDTLLKNGIQKDSDFIFYASSWVRLNYITNALNKENNVEKNAAVCMTLGKGRIFYNGIGFQSSFTPKTGLTVNGPLFINNNPLPLKKSSKKRNNTSFFLPFIKHLFIETFDKKNIASANALRVTLYLYKFVEDLTKGERDILQDLIKNTAIILSNNTQTNLYTFCNAYMHAQPIIYLIAKDILPLDFTTVMPIDFFGRLIQNTFTLIEQYKCITYNETTSIFKYITQIHNELNHEEKEFLLHYIGKEVAEKFNTQLQKYKTNKHKETPIETVQKFQRYIKKKYRRYIPRYATYRRY